MIVQIMRSRDEHFVVGAAVFDGNSAVCKVCTDEQVAAASGRKQNREMLLARAREMVPVALRGLFKRKTRVPKFKIGADSFYRFMPASTLGQWRLFVKGDIDTKPLISVPELCPHGCTRCDAR